jgi:UMF1 family MFS transporter
MATKLNMRIINAWCSYDIANSVYKLLINTALFPIYYGVVTKAAFNGDKVQVFGISLKNTVFYDYGLAFSFLIVAFISPLLSGIADAGNRRKRFMQVFTFLGALSCISMYWFNGNNLIYGILTVIFAAIGYEGAMLFYNSFLPRIAPRKQHDWISARGYSWGYAGSMVLLIINLIIITYYKNNGLDQLQALRNAFISVGIWWMAFSLIAFKHLKEDKSSNKSDKSIFTKGYEELHKVFNAVIKEISTRRFLASFFFYSMGLQTLMLVAILFGSEELGIEGNKLIVTIVILQVLAIAGATLFAKVSQRFSNKTSISYMLFIWLAVCIGGYFMQTTFHFYILAAGVGLVMGGIQSQSRSTYSKLIPEDSEDTASYFSFYNFTERIAVVVGMSTFGFIEQLTGSPRNSILALCVFFLVALILLKRTPLKKSFSI